MIGVIRFSEHSLGRQQTLEEVLSILPLDELTRLAIDLHSQVEQTHQQ